MLLEALTVQDASFSIEEGNLDDDALRSLLERTSDDLHGALLDHGRADEQQLWAFRVQEMAKAVSSQCISVWTDGLPVGLAIARPSPWDSSQLEVRCTNLELVISLSSADGTVIARSLVQHIVQLCRTTSDRLSLRVSTKQTALLHVLEDEGFHVMDCLLVFTCDGPSQQAEQARQPPSGIRVRPFRSMDLEHVKTLARSAFRDDRWHADPRIRAGVADNVYAAWAEACSQETGGAATLVAESSAGILGFACLRCDTVAEAVLASKLGIIDLIATSGAARGNGIGSALMGASMSWFVECGMDRVQVGTQSANAPACRLYERYGFKIAASSYALTRWVDHD
jgi:GNAT superfamily N-acetyltransferase